MRNDDIEFDIARLCVFEVADGDFRDFARANESVEVANVDAEFVVVFAKLSVDGARVILSPLVNNMEHAKTVRLLSVHARVNAEVTGDSEDADKVRHVVWDDWAFDVTFIVIYNPGADADLYQ